MSINLRAHLLRIGSAPQAVSPRAAAEFQHTLTNTSWKYARELKAGQGGRGAARPGQGGSGGRHRRRRRRHSRVGCGAAAMSRCPVRATKSCAIHHRRVGAPACRRGVAGCAGGTGTCCARARIRADSMAAYWREYRSALYCSDQKKHSSESS